MNNAEWMIQNGMKFSKLTWGHISGRNIVYYEPIKNIAVMTEPASTTKELYSEESASPKNIILKWLDMEHVEPVLNEEEKQYLGAVIKPFKDRFLCAEKISMGSMKYEYIRINIKSVVPAVHGHIELPLFKAGEMYKGMEVDKEYTVEELGL